MHKTIIGILVAISFATNVNADTFRSEKELKPFAESVMEANARGDHSAAFALMKPYVIISETEFDAAVLNSKAQRDLYGSRYGAAIGWEFIDEEKVGESFIWLRYIERTENHPITWSFYFYKGNDGWVLNTFSWSDQLNQLL